MRSRAPAGLMRSKRCSVGCAPAAQPATRKRNGVGRAVIEAAAAFGTGDRARPAALLDPVMPMMTSIGGSDAQDDLFRQTYLRSLQAAGRRADAAASFEAITAGKSCTPLDRVLAN